MKPCLFSHLTSGINNIRYIVSSPVYKGRGVVPRDLLEPPWGGTNDSLIIISYII